MRSPSGARAYFILSCARSGSTSLARILDMASNGICAVEPSPNLNVESRQMREGWLDDPMAVLSRTVLPRVATGLIEAEVYGEKDLTYGPFVHHLYKALKCRFVFLQRDGRDVVRSLIDWHNGMFGNIYRECHDPGNLTPAAMASAANLPLHLDTADYARPRPLPGEPFFEEWDEFSRLEMCAYYWQSVNNLYLDQLASIPRAAWISVDYTHVTAEDILRVAAFLDLEGLARDKIETALRQKINSLADRTATRVPSFPRWCEWTADYHEKFNALAGGTMSRLGYNVSDVSPCVGGGD